MIYQLMKIDPARRFLPFFIVVVAGTGVAFAASGVWLMGLPLLVMMAGMIRGVSQIQRGMAEFTSALPVARREVLLSTLALQMVLVWAGALLGWVVTVIFNRPGAAQFPEMAAAATPLVLAYRMLVMRERRWGHRIPQAGTIRRFPWWLLSWWDLFWMGMLFLTGLNGNWSSGLLFLWIGPSQSKVRLRFLEALPVSRSVVLALRVVPAVAALLAGLITGMYTGVFTTMKWNKVYIAAARSWPPVQEAERCPVANVVPPLEYWRRAVEGKTPLVTAPWGEQYRPPVVRVAGVGVYNPFAVGCNSSQRFLEWQYERASRAAYGRLVPKNDPDVKAPVRIGVVTLKAGIVAVLGLLVMVPLVLSEWWRFRRLPKFWIITLTAVMIAPLLSLALVPFLLLRGVVPEVLQVLVWFLPESLPGAAAIVATAAVSLYVLVDRLDAAAEMRSAVPKL